MLKERCGNRRSSNIRRVGCCVSATEITAVAVVVPPHCAAAGPPKAEARGRMQMRNPCRKYRKLRTCPVPADESPVTVATGKEAVWRSGIVANRIHCHHFLLSISIVSCLEDRSIIW